MSPNRRATSTPDVLAEGRGGLDRMWTALTPRERQVAVAVVTGMSNTQAAAALSITGKTVECHLGRIYTKLGLASRAQLAAALGCPGVVDPAVPWSSLTMKEQQVAAAVGAGMSNRQAALRLHLSPKTVEYHLGRVFRKLRIVSRRQLPAIIAHPVAVSAHKRSA
jgi:DNA-binding CsgD family transcriptional regulator